MGCATSGNYKSAVKQIPKFISISKPRRKPDKEAFDNYLAYIKKLDSVLNASNRSRKMKTEMSLQSVKIN
ncbi:unnamed protein product [Blepharisma stoltei]|uniref:Uncharacterized protein n=1 Tax=Blepharisma stoltei TaxID=1481888 RepID=A0AAU9KHW4_9CILI|nr:unnamed protein product [Blepharisma stoltei]